MNIIIYRDKLEGDLYAYQEYDYPFPNRELIRFNYDSKDKKWYFWGETWRPAIVKEGLKREFPMDFFCDLLRAKYFVVNGEGLNDDIKFIKGGNYIGLK